MPALPVFAPAAVAARPNPARPDDVNGNDGRAGFSAARHEAFFRELLSGIDAPTAPFGASQVTVGAPAHEARLTGGPDLARRACQQASLCGVPVASLFHVAWALALARLCDRDDVVFGVAVPGPATREGLPRGTSVLPFRIEPARGAASAVVQDAARRWAELLQHVDVEPELLERCTALPTGTALFDTVLDCRPLLQSGLTDAGRAGHQRVGGPRLAAAFGAPSMTRSMTMTVEDAGQGILLVARAPSQRLAERQCAYLVRALGQLLACLAEQPSTPLAGLDVMPADERHRLLDEWKTTEAPSLRSVTVQGLLEARAVVAPDAIALIDDDTTLSHAGLHAQANRLAHHLRALGVGPDVRVAVCMERCAELVVALLAILKAGGAYVPLDPSYPAERLAYFVADSAPAVLLTHSRVPAAVLAPLREHLGESSGYSSGGPAVIDLMVDADAWRHAPATPLDPEAVALNPDHLAYVAYTSGSTGRPKGVANTIAGLANRLAWFADTLLAEPPVTAMKTSIGFVDSLTEILQTLVAGGALVVFDTATARDPRRFAQRVQQYAVSKLVVVPSLLTQLLEVDASALGSVRTLVCSGERLAPQLARQVRARLHGARLLNLYGSSEVNGDASFHDCSADPPSETGGSPIGRPIANTCIRLLDRHGRLVPIGATGELFVGGAGLARGYLGRSDLTAERFIDDPFATGERLYKTGDLARYRDDGVLEFLGRIDHQVKLRGFRVELGEIETAIAAHPQVDKVVVVLREDVAGDPRLVAYVLARRVADCVADLAANPAVPAPASGLVDDLRQRLRRSLPDFMLPAHFVLLDALPLTPSGKLDRLSLPPPDRAVRPAQAAPVAPRDDLEASVRRLWHELLGVERLGVFDNFFESGGNSLLVVRLQTRLEQQFGRLLPLNALLHAPTVAGMAELLRSPSPANPSLLSIRPGRGAAPVFFVHDGFGETLLYRALAHSLNPDVPVYALCPLALAGQGWAHTRLRDMAAHYVAAIRAVQPQGPWVLAGLCSGGTIAFEMAWQLQQQGVAGRCSVVLIDANHASVRRRVGRFAQAEFLRHWGALVRELRRTAPLAALRAGLGFAGRMLALAHEPLRARVAAAAGRAKVYALQRCVDAGRAPPVELQQLPFDVVCSVAEAEHVARGTLESQVLLIRATQGNGDAGDVPFDALFADPLFGWARHVRGPLRAVHVPGGHYSMFQPPHVEALAAAIQAQVDAMPVAGSR